LGGVDYFGIWVYTEMGADVLDHVYRWIDKCLVFTVSNAELRDTLKSCAIHELMKQYSEKFETELGSSGNVVAEYTYGANGLIS